MIQSALDLTEVAASKQKDSLRSEWPECNHTQISASCCSTVDWEAEVGPRKRLEVFPDNRSANISMCEHRNCCCVSHRQHLRFTPTYTDTDSRQVTGEARGVASRLSVRFVALGSISRQLAAADLTHSDFTSPGARFISVGQSMSSS